MSFNIINKANMPLTLNERFEDNDAIYFFKQIFNVELDKLNLKNFVCEYYPNRLTFRFLFKNIINISLSITKDLNQTGFKDKFKSNLYFTILLKDNESYEKDEVVKLVEYLTSRIRYDKIQNKLKIDLKNQANEIVMEFSTTINGFKNSLEYYQKIITIRYFSYAFFGKEIGEDFFYNLMKLTPERDYIYIDELQELMQYSEELNLEDFKEMLKINYKK